MISYEPFFDWVRIECTAIRKPEILVNARWLVARNGGTDELDHQSYGLLLQGYADTTCFAHHDQIQAWLRPLGYELKSIRTCVGLDNLLVGPGHHYEFDQDLTYLAHVAGPPLLDPATGLVHPAYHPQVDRSKVARLTSLLRF